MKKFLALSLAVVMMVLCFVACGTQATPTGPKDITAEEEIRLQEGIVGIWTKEDRLLQIEFKALKEQNENSSGFGKYISTNSDGTSVGSHDIIYRLKENTLIIVNNKDTDASIKFYTISLNKAGNILSMTDEAGQCYKYTKTE